MALLKFFGVLLPFLLQHSVVWGLGGEPLFARTFFSDDDILLKPINGSRPACVIFVQGKEYPNDSYTTFARALQVVLANQGVALWVGIPSYPKQTVDPSTFPQGLTRVQTALTQMGMPNATHVFVLVHGPSSSEVAQAYFANHPDVSSTNAGLVFLGSTVSAQYLPNVTTAIASTAMDDKNDTGIIASGAPGASQSLTSATASKDGSLPEPATHPSLSSILYNSTGTKMIEATLTLPVLTLGGSLDGVNPITQLAVAYARQILQPPPSQPNATRNTPVLVVDGMSHTQISTFSPPPQYVLQLDLTPDLPIGTAQLAASEAVAAFVCTLMNQTPLAWVQLQSLQRASGAFLSPLVLALQTEGSYLLASPCYAPHTINVVAGGAAVDTADATSAAKTQLPHNSNTKASTQHAVRRDDDHRHKKMNGECWAGSVWLSDVAQTVMAGAQNWSWVDIANTDLFWPVDEVFPHDYLPFVNNSCPGTSTSTSTTTTTSSSSSSSSSSSNNNISTPNAFAVNCTLYSRTVTELWYDTASAIPSAASAEMMSKLNSRQRLWTHMGLNASDFNATDGGSLCAEINNASYTWALAHASDEALARFLREGQALVMGQDIIITVYPLWSSHRLQFEPAHVKEEDHGNIHAPTIVPAAKSVEDGPFTPLAEIDSSVLIRSPAMRFPESFPVVGGLHFCKLLSPARAIQWIYVDGLRASRNLV